MTTATVSSRNARKACVRTEGDRCSTHDAAFPGIAKTCWGKAEANLVAKASASPIGYPGSTAEVTFPHVVEALEAAHACEGSNHVPGCAHFPQAPVTFPPAAGSLSAAPAASPMEAGAALLDLPLDLVDVGDNVRVNLEDLEELAASIAEHGVLQPVKATGPHPDGRYLVTWGQRRTLASRMAGAATIRAMVLPPEADVDKHGSARSIEQLVENLHRKDLPALDRARAMREVIDGGKSQADLARELGIAPSTVANDLGLLEAPAPIQELIATGSITPAHAKAMKGLAPKTQVELAKDVVARGYSAHRTEEEVQLRKRNADLERERAQEQAKAIEANRAAIDAAIAEWPKKKVGQDDLVIAGSGYGYGDSGRVGHLVKLIQAAGYTNVRASRSWNEIVPRGGSACDCVAWKVSESERYSYTTGRSQATYVVSITKGCVKPEHQRSKEAEAEDRRRAKEAVATRVQQHVRRSSSGWALPEARAIAVDRILAEAMLWDLLSYHLPVWAEEHGGKKTNPFAAIHALSDEDLAKELAERIAGDFRDKAGYHVDWPALAAEYGLEGASGG